MVADTERPLLQRTWLLITAEAVVAFAACLILPLLMSQAPFNPLKRTGQVSGLATIQIGFIVCGLGLVALLLIARRWREGKYFDLVTRLSSAAIAGLASGFLAAGATLALLGTPWPMFGLNGDSGRIVEWSAAIVDGKVVEDIYPPLPLYTLGYFAEIFHDGNTAYAFKDLQILGAAVTGPLAYLAWRMVLSPLWALAVGVLPASAFMDSYKPYGQTILIVLLPVLAAFFATLRRTGTQDWKPVLLKGFGFGLLFSAMFLTYSGWFIWAALGSVVAAALLFPWKTGPLKGLAYLGTALATFLLLCGWYLENLLRSNAKDRAFGFDAYTDPAYFNMWRTDMPGEVPQWPPPGEFGGVHLFTIVLFVGLGISIWLGIKRSVVITAVCVFASAWLLRLWYASHMFSTGTVQLWPRTSNQLLYAGMVLCALAILLIYRQLKDKPVLQNGMRSSAVVGAVCGLLMLFGSVMSSMADRYMPAKDNTYKILPWVSHTVTQLDGSCPKFAPNGQCSKDGDQSWQQMFAPGNQGEQ
ncbi:hypothetical protein [Catelliglobosispora koreensis]|uniref:hypothetical protein n=1 Tax=Catelliglobosispora koreensis TaxID=129052 RepID=UPI000366AE03|nr:hypothetical protein [Catelliglobosispora koreensis]